MARVSPIKRVTRARAAAKTTATPTKPKTTKTKNVTEEPPKKLTATRRAKADVEEQDEAPLETVKPARKTTVKPTKTIAPLAMAPKRRVRVTPLNTTPLEPEAVPVKKASSKSKKTAPKTDAKVEIEKPTATKKAIRATRTKTILAEPLGEDSEPAPEKKARGRPKKSATQAAESDTIAVAPARQTRARTVSNASAANVVVMVPAKASNAARKKVTFQDLPEDDKENIPVQSKKQVGKKVPVAAPATGLRAKPIRKPASATAGVRKKAAPAAKKGKAGSAAAGRVLTPKKITQIAKALTPTDPEASEDELNGSKTPLRELSLSPKRAPVLAPRSPSPVKKLDFTAALLSPSGGTEAPAINLTSPARRPPLSPYKDALKDSPRRGDVLPVFPTSTRKLPENNDFTILAATQSPTKLLQSPKRGLFDASTMFSNSIMKSKTSPLKVSLMKSPARRLFSPQKSTAGLDALHAADHSPSNIAARCNFRSSQSPERGMKLYNLTEDELAQQGVTTGGMDFDESVLNIRSPLKAQKLLSPMRESPEDASIADEEELQDNTAKDDTSDIDVEDADDIELMDNLPDIVTAAEVENEAPAALNVSSPTHFRDMDDASEDELQSPDKTFQLGGETIQFRTSTGMSDLPQGMGFTPLTAKFNDWRASSPAKQSVSATKPSMFSPIAEQHIPGEVVISRQSTPKQKTPASIASSRFSTTTKKLLSSSKLSISQTPSKPSFFEDEMQVTDFDRDDGDSEAQDRELLDMHAGFATADAIAFPENHLDDAMDDDDADEQNLTTDLVNQTLFTDTAVIDFAALAEEADQVAEIEAVEANDGSEAASERSFHGAENVAPTVVQASAISRINGVADAFATPPIRRNLSHPRYVNTVVSKVPLRPEGQLSPLKVARKRARSMSMSNDLASNGKRRSLGPLNVFPSVNHTEQQSPTFSTPGQTSFVVDDFGDSTLDAIELPDDFEDEAAADVENSVLSIAMSTPTSLPKSTPKTVHKTPLSISARTPGLIRSNLRSVSTPTSRPAAGRSAISSAKRTRAPLEPVTSSGGILFGATVYVDVHTSEGADASSIFVDLLTSMGARCVKEWRWNSHGRASLTANESGEAITSVANQRAINDFGITHVVYKDGGVKTLERVQAANKVVNGGFKGQVQGEGKDEDQSHGEARGQAEKENVMNVLCVGVAWVLDCERQSKWLPETPYLVDLTYLPRGGSRRRKSMEPRMLIADETGLLTSSVKKVQAREQEHGRRSVSATDMFTREMRDELVNTPVRNSLTGTDSGAGVEDKDNAGNGNIDDGFDAASHQSIHLLQDHHFVEGDDYDDEDEDDTEIISPVRHHQLQEPSFISSTAPDDLDPTVDDLHFGNTPAGSRSKQRASLKNGQQTPTGYVRFDPAVDATPAARQNENEKLVQMTCPPKQTRKGLFERDESESGNKGSMTSGVTGGADTGTTGGNGDGKQDEATRRRLDAIRRRTMDVGGFGKSKPRIRSPLGRGL